MLIDEIKGIDSSRRELRKFGFVMAGALAVIGGLLLWRGKSYYPYFFGCSLLLGVLGAALPSMLMPIQKAWMTLAVIMGWIMTRVILCVLFYVVLTPIALLMRLLGKDILDMKFGSDDSTSYWIPRQTDASEERDYERQF